MKKELQDSPLSKIVPAASVALLSALVYINILPNAFVYDDRYQVLRNWWIKDPANIVRIFTSSAWGFSKELSTSHYYRPVMHLVYMADYALFGLRPKGFHLTSILFHALNSVTVFFLALYLLRKHGGGEGKRYTDSTTLLVAFGGAALFATTPINTEAVAWIAGIPELTFTLFYLLAFYTYIKWRDGGGAKSSYPLLSALFFFLAALSKETAATLPLLLFTYDIVLKKDSVFHTPVKEWLKRYLPFAFAGILYLLMRTNALVSLTPGQPWHHELTGLLLFINVFPLLGEYFYKLLVPANLNAFHVLHPVLSPVDIRFVASFIFIVLIALVILRLRIKDPLPAFLLLWIVVPLLPVLYIPVLGESTFAERYMYLPSAGFSMLIAISIHRLLQGLRMERGVVFLSVIALIASVYSTGTVKRNKIWHDQIRLFSDIVKKSPDGATPHYSLGFAYYRIGEIDEAIKHYKKALALNPVRGDWHHDLGLAYQKKGLADLAIKEYHEAIRLGFAKDPDTHINLANAYVLKRMYDKAILHYRKALSLDPENELAKRNLSIVMKMQDTNGPSTSGRGPAKSNIR